LAHNELILSIL